VIAFANLLAAIAGILDMLLNVLIILIFARVVVSWLSADPYNPLVRFITSSTDAFLLPLKKRFKMIYGTIDLSPLLLLLAVYFVKFFVVVTLLDYAREIKVGSIGSQISMPIGGVGEFK
jgi:YggT family protein